MSTNHLLSTSLFTELFQHNLVSPNGRIIASPKELEDYYQFLVRQSKERVSMLYAERKKVMDVVLKLLDIANRTDQQTKLLKRLLKELDLKIEEDGQLTSKEWTKPRKKYLGPKEPKMSLFEIEIEAELNNIKILKRDLKILDEWLSEISTVRPMADHAGPSDPKKAGGKLAHKVKNRMIEMEKARAKLIRQFYMDYDRDLEKVIRPESRDLSDMNNSSKSSAVDEGSSNTERVKSDDTVVMKPEPKNSSETDVDSDQSTDSVKSEDTVVMKPEPKNSSETDVDSDQSTDSVKSEDTVVMKPERKNCRESDVDSDHCTDSVKSEDTVVMKPEPKNSGESDVDSDYSTDSVKSEDTVVTKPEPKNSRESDVDSDHNSKQGG